MVRRHTRGLCVAAIGLALAASVSGLASSPVAATPTAAGPTLPTAFPAKAAAQIAALQDIKATLSPAERKLDSRLVVKLRDRAGRIPAKALPRLTSEPEVGTETIDVDITATEVGSGLPDRLRGLGATVGHVSPLLDTFRASVPSSTLIEIASWDDVAGVAIADEPTTSSAAGPDTAIPKERLDHWAAPKAATSNAAAPTTATPRVGLRALSAAPGDPGDQGTVVSEGDKTHGADFARAAAGVAGAGVKVCVLSDGVNGLADTQAAGELPAVDILPGQEGSGAEGTAMLEIVHDLAPDATLGFATGFDSAAGFADNIRALRFEANCDILVDDLYYHAESPFQDGPIAQAVDAVTADGALYFSSAGNDGNVLDGTSGTYEATFVASDGEIDEVDGELHDFDPGPGVQLFQPLGEPAGDPLTLFWADPLGASENDYDIYLFDDQNNVVGSSQNVQDGTQDPYETLRTPLIFGQLRVAVVKHTAAADRYLHLHVNRGTFADSPDGLHAYVTSGSLKGHAAAADAFSIAATPAAGPYLSDPANPTGPFPNLFTGDALGERFTADGPRRIFFEADGTPITPGDFSETGGTVRQVPAFTAADGVSTTSTDGGLNPFYGTSAAAPHAAAIAALYLSVDPAATVDDVRAALTAGSVDLAPAGYDGRTGHGVLRADLVLASAPDRVPPVLTLPANITVEATAATGEVVTFTATATDDVDGAIAPMCIPASGSTFPIRPTTVICTAQDAAENEAIGTFTVTVVDTTAPELTLPDDLQLEATGSDGAVADYEAAATDLVDGAITPTCSPAAGGTFPLGPTTVTCDARDAALNEATDTFAVTVVDTTAPVITVPDDIRAAATSPSGAVVEYDATAVDVVNGTVPVTCTPASGSVFPTGTTTVTCSASDPPVTVQVATNTPVARAKAAADEPACSTATFRIIVSAYVAPTSGPETTGQTTTRPTTPVTGPSDDPASSQTPTSPATGPTETPTSGTSEDPAATGPAGTGDSDRPTTPPSAAPSTTVAPQPTSQIAAPPVNPAPPGGGPLARTGIDIAPLLSWAALCLAAGVVMLRVGRRHRPRGSH